MHFWGDGFDFERLNEAGEQIANLYKLLSGYDLYWKEKYGTLRYEWLTGPVLDYDSELKAYDEKVGYSLYQPSLENEHFAFAVLLTVTDYPDMMKEILSDFLMHNRWDEIDKLRKNKDQK